MTTVARHDSLPKQLTLQERILGAGALRKIGNATVTYTLDDHGNRIHSLPMDVSRFDELTGQFKKEPKGPLGYMRHNLIAISKDKRLGEPTRTDRLGRYLDAYTSLTIKLDHAAFTETDDGRVYGGVPEYVPDGFIDMGGEPSPDPKRRGRRDQIKVDKAAIYKKYHKVLMDIFLTDYPDARSDATKESMVATLMQTVYFGLPYDYGAFAKNGDIGTNGVAALHDMSEGVCRHQALTFQVLAQACGLTSRLVKCDMDGGRHAANAVRINKQWRLIDVTNPDYVTDDSGAYHWRPCAVKIPHAPVAGEHIKFKAPNTKIDHDYHIHNDMYWRLAG